MATEEHVNNPHDKEIRKVLMNKKEGKIFINKALNLKEEEKLSEKNLYNYNSSFVNSKLQNKISDVIYKVVNREEIEEEIYIIIEHQRAIDPKMRIRMFEYKSLVIRQALDENNINAKGYRQPVVIGIVLYTGERKWKEEKETIVEEPRKLKEYINQSLIDYALVDANKLKEEELLAEDTVLSKIILLERVHNIQEIKETLAKIMKEKISKEAKEEVIGYTVAMFSNCLKIDKQELEEVLKNLYKEEREMMHIEEVLIRERDSWLEEGKSKGRLEGRVEGRLKIIKKMIKGKVKDELIKEYTDVNEKELEKIKKEMQSQTV